MAKILTRRASFRQYPYFNTGNYRKPKHQYEKLQETKEIYG